MGHNLETRSFLDEVRSFDNAGVLFDLGHPLLNRMAGSFVTAAGIGAVQAVSREACFTALENVSGDETSMDNSKKLDRFRSLQGETNRNSVEALVCLLVRVARLCNYGYMLMKIMALLVTSTGKESLQWGLAAGMYSGLTFGLKEARGVHDWNV
ncbi:outer envelope pore protein 16-2, chloroplastic-like isoform X4 [Cynara cardunculus var. scolymus]|uniref:outer envelope pore protein 16-2, chloroplastic-like isoform X4 n=1 Tax=Cynara cardunculus var. scolymus TaxID=59895 RepID=UPI000D62FE10|nr:outer envelope pore protein 16-2, chloroplastic-like isoform X4 [Cynara cardunculus var. scolymus]